MSSTEYIDIVLDTNPESILQDIVSTIQTAFPGWQPNEGQLDYILMRATAIQAAENRDVASRVPRSIYRTLGAELFNFPPVEATHAIVASTWVVKDNLGYTIPAGTQVGIRNSAGELFPFQVMTDVVVIPGTTTTAAGAVSLIALTSGEESSGLGGAGITAELIDVKDYIISITLTGITTGGISEESDDEYLDRLTRRLRRLSLRPILPRDFADMALDADPSVARAVALDGYNPAAGGSYGNERMVAIAGHDAVGNALSAPVKAIIDATLQANRETTFVVNVIDPTYTFIDVTYNVKALALYNTTDLLARINVALSDYLSPAKWGSPAATIGTNTTDWNETLTVRFYEILQVINNVEGVDYIIGTPTIRKQGDAMASVDVTIPGPAALTRPGVFTGTVTP